MPMYLYELLLKGDLNILRLFVPQKPALPIRAIATSVPFWALLVAHASFNWAFYTMLTCMPTYMKEVLKFDMSEVRNNLLHLHLS